MDWMKKMNLSKCHQQKRKMQEYVEEAKSFVRRINRKGEITEP